MACAWLQFKYKKIHYYKTLIQGIRDLGDGSNTNSTSTPLCFSSNFGNPCGISYISKGSGSFTTQSYGNCHDGPRSDVYNNVLTSNSNPTSVNLTLKNSACSFVKPAFTAASINFSFCS